MTTITTKHILYADPDDDEVNQDTSPYNWSILFHGTFVSGTSTERDPVDAASNDARVKALAIPGHIYTIQVVTSNGFYDPYCVLTRFVGPPRL